MGFGRWYSHHNLVHGELPTSRNTVDRQKSQSQILVHLKFHISFRTLEMLAGSREAQGLPWEMRWENRREMRRMAGTHTARQ